LSPIPGPPAPGQIVHVRQRRYLVESVTQPPKVGDATLVSLSCIDDDAQQEPLEVLWEAEVDPEILVGEPWDHLASRGFDPPDMFAAYLHTLRWNCATATDPKLFQSPFRAGIRIDAYQLEPLRKALLLPRVNLFIADDVGLGKTIEAGLIARELLMRRKVTDIIVACPPSMLWQWREEMDSRFGIAFEILDRDYVTSVRRERGFGVNPWTTHTRFLISHRLLIDEDYAGPLRDWLGDLRPGSLLILDEAHHAAPASGARYAIDSGTTRAIRDLSPRFEHRLFLSATPHNGHSNSFSALLELLDPQRFCRGVPVGGKKHTDPVMVRRLKEDVRALEGGFPKRTVVQIDVDGLPDDAPELVLPRLLDAYRDLRDRRLADESRRVQTAAGLLISGLQQRLLSSIEAFARTLRVHRRTVQRQWEHAEHERQLARGDQTDLLGGGVSNDDDRAILSEEELGAEEEAQIEAATAAAPADVNGAAAALFEQEQRLLDQMTDVAETARGDPDGKVFHLVSWIRDNMCPDLPPIGRVPKESEAPKWNVTRLIVFTEYDDTKRYVRAQLEAAIAHTDRADERIAVYHGPTPPERREEIKRAFNMDPRKHPVRILIATDAAREGLNLQTHCFNVFHFDVPWNPSRMEQRNGRIDRKLQPAPEVFCHYFAYRQRPEDRILRTLVRKTDTIRKELGSVAEVVEGRLADTLKLGIERSKIDELQREIEEADIDSERKETAERELEETRDRQADLRRQIERLRDRIADSRRFIAFDEQQFRSALSCALGLLGADPLASDGEGDGGPPRFKFPALDQAVGADPTWADTMDTLRPPRARDEKVWEWRRDAPVRPVLFEDPGTMDEDVVHLHLEHKVARRLLSRFTAQGFVHHDLSRACLAQSSDAIPRVILLGRLALYGSGGTRLHEQVVPVTARWVDPADRSKPLKPTGRAAEAATLELLEGALGVARKQSVPGVVQQRLQAAAPRDIRELLPHLEQRAAESAAIARDRLKARSEDEAEKMRSVIQEQLARVQKEARRFDDPQLRLDVYAPEEKRQLEANRRHWDKRVQTMKDELVSEPERIRSTYEVAAQRIEPVGLVYLWPATG
jgi:hypothetical protein